MKPLSFILTIVVLLWASCQSKDGDYTFFTTADDLALGEKISAQIAADPQNFPLIDEAAHPELYAYFDKMLAEILNSGAILHKNELAWELKIIDNDTIYNAFCTPGGYIYVYTGLVKFVESEDELAGILAHEVAHGDLRHSTDQLTKSYGLKLLASLLIDGDAEILANIGVNLLGLKFSRSDESEADTYAVRYLSDTNYNPVAFAEFFERMQSSEQAGSPLQFLSTHPDPGNRVEKIKEAGKLLGENYGKSNTENFKRLQQLLP